MLRLQTIFWTEEDAGNEKELDSIKNTEAVVVKRENIEGGLCAMWKIRRIISPAYPKAEPFPSGKEQREAESFSLKRCAGVFSKQINTKEKERLANKNCGRTCVLKTLD